MKNAISYITTLICLSMVFVVKAQEVLPLVVEASWEDSTAVFVRWQPTDAEKWIANLEKGYRVERYELALPEDTNYDSFNKKAATAKTSAKRNFPDNGAFLPADTMWFYNNRYLGSGYGKAMSMMIHDTLFDVAADGGSNHVEKHQYAIFGMTYYPEKMSEGLGLGFYDMTADKTKDYRYVVTSVSDSKVTGSVNLSYTIKSENYNTGNFSLDFTDFPFKNAIPKLPTNYRLEGLAQAFGDSIVVRWAPTSPSAMYLARHLGYKVIKSKRTFIGNKKVDPNFDFVAPAFEYTILDTIDVLPWDSTKVEAYKASTPVMDSMMMVAAQFMFSDNAKSETNMMAKGDMMESMHAYALYAAERSGLAAELLGLRYVDYEIDADSAYSYRIEMPLDSIDPTGYSIDPTFELVNDYKGPEGLEDVKIAELEYALSIGIHRKNEKKYSFFFFERSDDGGNTWRKLNEKPMKFETDVSLENEVEYFALVDSVDVLYKTFKYRVRGVSTFGEYSPWSEVEGMAVDLTPPPAPIINDPKHINFSTAEITWIGDHCEVIPDHIGYLVNMGHVSDPEELTPISGLLPKGTFRYEYQQDTFSLDSMYFFQVTAIDTAGNQGVSFPSQMTLVDSIPPAIPMNLQGSVDSNGIVTILWEQVTDSDLAGYRVLFANNPDDEFIQLTTGNRTVNFYQDTISLNSLNKAVYYKVLSIDVRFNQSDLSEPVLVKRPDIIPPVMPVMLQPTSTGDAVSLTWRMSSSVDVANHFLYRRPFDVQDENGEPLAWELLDSLTATTEAYLDTTAAYEQIFEYTVRAKDDAENYSEYTLPLQGRRFFDEAVSGISDVRATFNEGDKKVMISWSYQPPEDKFLKNMDYRYMLYRAKGDDPLERYKQLTSKEPTYTDKFVKGEVTYRYAMMVVFEDGKKSGISTDASVTIPRLETEGGGKK